MLGIIGRCGPVTAHTVRREFAGSPSSYWSASTGAIYPLLKRLEERGAVRCEVTPFGTRDKRTYTLSKQGRKALASWIDPPLSEWHAGALFDPIRARVGFLGQLSVAARRRFFERAIRATDDALAHYAELKARGTGITRRVGCRGVRWLDRTARGPRRVAAQDPGWRRGV